MIVPVGTVLAVPLDVLELFRGVWSRKVLEEELRAREKGHPIAWGAGSDGSEVLEVGNLGDLLLDSGGRVDFFLEKEEAVVVHRHGLGGSDSAGFGVGVSGVLDGLTIPKDPRGDCADVMSLRLEDVLILRVSKAT